MRMKTLTAASVLVLLGALAGCGPSSSEGPSDTVTISEAPDESEAPASEAVPQAEAPAVKDAAQNASVDRFGEPQFADGADVEDIAATGDTRRRDPTPPTETETAPTPVEGQ